MAKPNILLITSDQQHWNTLGCINPEVKTPNIDRLAREGTRFTRAYCPNPTCTPTRASILTGKYPSQHGAYALGTKLPESEPTVTNILRQQGYRTALIGKAHFQPLHSTDDYPSLESYPILQDLGFWRRYDKPFYGFDHVELARNHGDEAHVGQHYAIWMEEKGLTNWRDYFRPPTGTNDSQKHKWLIPEEYHYNTWIAERSCAMLEQYQQQDEPFVLWASFFDPHPPYLVPEPWDTMYDPQQITVPQMAAGEHDHNPPHIQMTQQENPDYSAWQEAKGNAIHGFTSHLQDREALAKDIAVYYGMISCMDKYIGQIVDKLDALGLAENTLVIFTSDHGHYYGQHGLIAKGAFHYEDGLRVPLIVRQPGRVPAGVESDALQSLVDFAPTFLGACDIPIPPDMTGVDQHSVWFGTVAAHREWVIVENHHQPTTIHMKTYIDPRFKLTVYFERDYGELYDLQNDPHEVHNRWSDPAYKTAKAILLARLLWAEVVKEEDPGAVVRFKHKAAAMYSKIYRDDNYLMIFAPNRQQYRLYDIQADPEQRINLWDNPDYVDTRTQMLWKLLFARMKNEPLWMPRIAGA